MAKKVAVAKSAQLLGISRHEIQRLIRDGEIGSFDGMVDIEELRARYPTLTLDESPMLERVRFIKKSAFSRRVQARVESGKDDLEKKLGRAQTEQAVQKGRADHYHAVLTELMRWLVERRGAADSEQRGLIEEINQWLGKRLGGSDD